MENKYQAARCPICNQYEAATQIDSETGNYFDLDGLVDNTYWEPRFADLANRGFKIETVEDGTLISGCLCESKLIAKRRELLAAKGT